MGDTAVSSHGTAPVEKAEAGSAQTVLGADLLVCELFATIDVSLLDELAFSADLLQLERGHILTRQGDAADCLYVVLDGLVEVLAEHAVAEHELIDVLGPGTCVGDMALLLRRPRTTTVRALRQSRVVRISAESFDRLVTHSPDFALRLARMLGERLRRTTRHQRRTRPIRAIAIVAIGPGTEIADFCDKLNGALTAEAISTACVSAADFDRDCAAAAVDAGALGHWISAQEQRYHCILYRCEAEATEWTRQCLRQADQVLMVTRASAASIPERVATIERLATEREPRPRVELAILHDTGPPYHGTHRWLRCASFSSWHHLRLGSGDDYARLGRRLLGRANGLVLSGGGARGFAHIGVLQAIQEAGLPIDYIAGTSMGAILGAQFAAGYDLATMVAVNKSAFGQRRGFPDITFPFVALRNGRSTNAMLKQMFGALRIEDLPIPYFCVSSNLTRAEFGPARARATLAVDAGELHRSGSTAARALPRRSPRRRRDA